MLTVKCESMTALLSSLGFEASISSLLKVLHSFQFIGQNEYLQQGAVCGLVGSGGSYSYVYSSG